MTNAPILTALVYFFQSDWSYTHSKILSKSLRRRSFQRILFPGPVQGVVHRIDSNTRLRENDNGHSHHEPGLNKGLFSSFFFSVYYEWKQECFALSLESLCTVLIGLSIRCTFSLTYRVKFVSVSQKKLSKRRTSLEHSVVTLGVVALWLEHTTAVWKVQKVQKVQKAWKVRKGSVGADRPMIEASRFRIPSSCPTSSELVRTVKLGLNCREEKNYLTRSQLGNYVDPVVRSFRSWESSFEIYKVLLELSMRCRLVTSLTRLIDISWF